MIQIIDFFYPENNSLKKTLISHSESVCRKALEIAENSGIALDLQLVQEGAMLHDIGIFKCNAPGIFCNGAAPYISHGIIGGKLLREYGAVHGIDLEKHAGICENHTGSGLSTDDIKRGRLPLPERDFLPVTPEEKLVCLADKFFSKSHPEHEKNIEEIRSSMKKFHPDTLARFDELCRFFHIIPEI